MRIVIVRLCIVFFVLLLPGGVSLHPDTEPVEREILFTATIPFKNVEGHCEEIRFEKGRLDFNGAVPVLKESVLVSVPLTGMKTGISRRDSHMLEVLGYPEQKSIEGKITRIVAAKDVGLLISGTLTINGVERPFESRAVSVRNGETVQVSGEFSLLLPDFDVEPPDLLLIRVDDLVRIRYSFRFKP